MEYFYQEEERLRKNDRKKDAKERSTAARQKYTSPTSFQFTIHKIFSLEEIKELDRQTFEYPVISFYLTLSGYNTLRDPKNYVSTFNSLKTETMKKRIEYVESMTSKEHGIVMEGIEQIRAYIENDIVTDGYKSFIIFKSGDKLNKLIQLPVPVRNAFVIDMNPYTLPLEMALAENKKYLFVQFTKEEALINIYRFGIITKEKKIEADSLPEAIDGTRPGKTERHIEHYHDKYMRHVCEYIQKRMDNHDLRGVIIMGHEKTETEKLLNHFPKELKDKMIGVDYISPEEQHDLNVILKSIQVTIARYEKRQEREMIKVVEQAEGKRELIMGLRQVVAAQNRGLIQHLYINPYEYRGGYRCRNHSYLSLRPADCDVCQQPLQRIENIIDELIEISRTHNASTHLFVQEPHLLDMYENVAALPYSR